MRIYELRLHCRHFEQMKDFYVNILEMELITETDQFFSCMAGTTKLIFERSQTLPFYHVCFRTNGNFFDHIFSNLGKASVLLADENGSYSMFWKGKQAYFSDPDGNVIEMIERGPQPGIKGWLDIGEVGLAVDDVGHFQETMAPFIKNEFNSSSNHFAFYGDQLGVFVIVKEGRHWYPTKLPATKSPLTITVAGEEENTFNYEGYRIIVKEEWNHPAAAAQFRIARPTNQMDKIIEFYEAGLGLNRIGEFQSARYLGLMLGLPDQTYHLEFTQSTEKTELPIPSHESLLVFYIPNRDKCDALVNRLRVMGYPDVEPENPYWGKGGVTFEDPDGWRIVLMNTVGI
ncbi:VOC family protein [Cytobacillus purgationiresistens]|uniref:Catechol 2,3-dioxygenase-like lactoylglutathione lyase family enzyme n=1 Tax=Cytobacillus purgationiresistens TaxID=863449 RepID=A0ABU0AFU6_9BACI|nr:VOC family protein [Cytobacillus purgationiresistens]MDQ0270137.1 catechol 2,3-dioxygenase-like lactoylglutathione lyase family enzyme [Cytobacillus purgationiresistens]